MIHVIQCDALHMGWTDTFPDLVSSIEHVRMSGLLPLSLAQMIYPIAFGPPAPGPGDVGMSGCMVSLAGWLVGWLIGCLACWLAVQSTKLEVENQLSWF